MSYYLRSLDKIEETMAIIGESSKSIKEGLEDAFVAEFGHINENDLPTPLQKFYQKIRKKLTNNGSIQATVRQMAEEEAASIALNIFKLYLDLKEYLQNLNKKISL